MKGILVNPFRSQINEVETTGDLIDLYSLIGCRNIKGAYQLGRRNVFGNGEVVFVDEVCARKIPRPPLWFVDGYRWPIYGRGVVLGYRGDGESVSTQLTVDQVRLAVVFN